MRFSSFTASCRAPLLDGAQELDLHGDGELRHLVEEQGPPAGGLEEPRLVRHRPGEAALSVPEELALPKVLRDDAAVDWHERLAGPGSLIVDVGATSSLPVPDSPEMYTGAWLRASFVIVARITRMASESPISRVSASGRRSETRRAWPTTTLSPVRSMGLVMKSRTRLVAYAQHIYNPPLEYLG